MPKVFPPRLHVILARDAKVAVVFRRGPSKSVCTMLWDRKRDTFRIGQWFRGRIYERRADLSPDGKFLIYFAMNGKVDSETGGSWTAISRAPWLKAIVLLAKGDCWHGGGLFTGDRQYWLNDDFGHRIVRDSTQVVRDNGYHPEQSFECEARVRPNARTGEPNFLGNFVNGLPDERFLYLSWRPKDYRPVQPAMGSASWTRRMKIHLSGITWQQIEEATQAGRVLEVSIQGTGKDGGPNCASVPLMGGGWTVRNP